MRKRIRMQIHRIPSHILQNDCHELHSDTEVTFPSLRPFHRDVLSVPYCELNLTFSRDAKNITHSTKARSFVEQDEWSRFPIAKGRRGGHSRQNDRWRAAAYIKADGTRARGQEGEEREGHQNVGHLGRSSHTCCCALGCNQSTDERDDRTPMICFYYGTCRQSLPRT